MDCDIEAVSPNDGLEGSSKGSYEKMQIKRKMLCFTVTLSRTEQSRLCGYTDIHTVHTNTYTVHTDIHSADSVVMMFVYFSFQFIHIS